METDVRVRDVESVGPDAVALTLEAPEEFDALPGQFVLVRAQVGDEEVARHYTISSPDVEDTFELTVEVDPDGDLSPWLADRGVGDRLRIEGPFGNVAYAGDTDAVVIAGGPGVGPAVGIAERAWRSGREAAIVYRDTEPLHSARLEALEEGGVDVTVLDADEDLGPSVARVVDRGTVYVFGFRDFCEAALDAVEAAGGNREAAQVENFG